MTSRTVLNLTRLAYLALCLSLAGGSFAEETGRKFFFNAYFTQAWGETDGGQVLGLDEDGTFDYRSAALLFRYQPTKNDRVVVQLSHERIGASPLALLRDDVELDWAFYEHRFNSGYEVRLGRVPIPFGIYNEIRDVGTLLEFYRPPVSIYFEGAFSSETVDGGVLSKRFFESHPWSLSVDLYAGSWDRPEFLAPEVYEGTAKNAYGAQLWLQTPAEGVQIGLAAQHFDQEGGAVFLRGGKTDPFDIYLLSLNADFEHFVLHAEGQWIETRFLGIPKVEIPGYYGLAGWRFSEQFEAYYLYEKSFSRWKFGSDFPTFEFGPLYEDRAISFIYRITPKALVRVEAHHYETISPDVVLPLGQQSMKTDFAILSFSLTY